MGVNRQQAICKVHCWKSSILLKHVACCLEALEELSNCCPLFCYGSLFHMALFGRRFLLFSACNAMSQILVKRKQGN
ncbi:hypothetical protein CsSME_00010102 [Camellia sinensis var. sinensis]